MLPIGPTEQQKRERDPEEEVNKKACGHLALMQERVGSENLPL
jgi:hypothetical protein